MSKESQSEHAQLVDIGVNFHSAQLVSLTDQLLVRARAANVAQILATGTSAASSRLAVELARANPGTVFATAGTHPHGAKSYRWWRLDQQILLTALGIGALLHLAHTQRIGFARCARVCGGDRHRWHGVGIGWAGLAWLVRSAALSVGFMARELLKQIVGRRPSKVDQNFPSQRSHRKWLSYMKI